MGKLKKYNQFINEWLPLQGAQNKLEENFAGNLNDFFK